MERNLNRFTRCLLSAGGVQRSQDTALGSVQRWKVVSKFSICLLPGVFFSTQMAAVCMVATRILCVYTAGSQSAALMWS